MQRQVVYATTLNPECFDYRMYDIREDEGNEVIIDGCKDFNDIDNKGYLSQIKGMISDYNSYLFDCYYEGSIMHLIGEMLPKKENGKRYSPKEASKIKVALDNDNDKETICVCLSIIVGKEYGMYPLRGYCQGDYVEAYYPKIEGIKKYLDYIEAWFFGTGTEIMVHEEENEPTSAEEIEGWTFYTASWDIDSLKEEIKSQCGYKKEDDVEVKLWLYDKTETIHIDKYKLAD